MKIDGFLGAVLEPGDDGYEAARHIWNGGIKRRPAVIARCMGTADVMAAVRSPESGRWQWRYEAVGTPLPPTRSVRTDW